MRNKLLSLFILFFLFLSACNNPANPDKIEEKITKYEYEIQLLQDKVADLKIQQEEEVSDNASIDVPASPDLESAVPQEPISFSETTQDPTHISDFVEKADIPEDEDRIQIVVFGDSIWDSTRDETGIAHLVSQYMNADVYNCAIGGTRAAIPAGDTTDNYDTWTSTSLVGMVNAAIGRVAPAQFLTGYVAGGVMQNIDFSQTDYFILAYGLNDYFSATPLTHDPNDYLNVTNYRGALSFAIDRLRGAYPDAQILLISPTYCQFWDEGTDGNLKNYGNGTCQDYFHVIQNIAQTENTLFIDAYITLGINSYTALDYLSDGIHLNALGRELYAKAVSSCLKYGQPGQISGNSVHY